MKHILSKEHPNINKGISAISNYTPDLTKVVLMIYDDELDKVYRKSYEVHNA